MINAKRAASQGRPFCIYHLAFFIMTAGMSTPVSPDLIVSVSGIRGIIGQSLTPDAACRFGSALGTYLKGGRVVLSRDSRPSGRMVRSAVTAGLTAAGCSVEDIGI